MKQDLSRGWQIDDYSSRAGQNEDFSNKSVKNASQFHKYLT